MKAWVPCAIALVGVVNWVPNAQGAAGGGGSDAGNGGNESALEFDQSARTALQIYGNVLKTYPELRGVDLVAILERAQILVASTPLYAVANGVKQPSTALNFPESKTVILDGRRWKRITQKPVREALALHELLGLAGVEGTGNYFISKKYLSLNGVNCASGLCENGEGQWLKKGETFCRLNTRWYPSFSTYKYRFECSDAATHFEVWCDLFQDPVEFGSNKIDVLGGKWLPKDHLGGVLEYRDIDAGAVRCTYEDSKSG